MWVRRRDVLALLKFGGSPSQIPRDDLFELTYRFERPSQSDEWAVWILTRIFPECVQRLKLFSIDVPGHVLFANINA